MKKKQRKDGDILKKKKKKYIVIFSFIKNIQAIYKQKSQNTSLLYSFILTFKDMSIECVLLP